MRPQISKTVRQASVGILMLDTQFPRILGDIGNAQTWNFPVHYKIVTHASPDLVVGQDADNTLSAFIEAGKDLIALGVDGITTSCGFLSIFQDELSAALKVPVATSSLMQVQMVNALLPPDKTCGILTISGSSLSDRHLQAANVPPETPIGSTEGLKEFTRAILGNETDLDVAAAQQDNVDAALDLIKTHPNIGAIVLECTNMVPYAAAIQNAVRMPVFSMLTFVEWFQSGLIPRHFTGVEAD